ncbi:GNAT family N-acetyltransferase [Microlunatus flavus]|uniref:Protein N-acetyltransferase, RimJ/RimL family n=1 Tax=Microlunatus flavus TaxID=1036181 RepID=A0A1H9L6V5_9ACTN|nr:GNAT family N-acetyltransferase [Microlunatus flavus]SER06959.1 Protein N-acetyltransferase, RimJ/RimL family [Microlunatus flavus]
MPEEPPVRGAISVKFPVRTARLDLRPHREDDLDDLLRFHSDPEVVRYIPWPVRDLEQTRAALQVKIARGTEARPGEWLMLAIELRETGSVIGEVLLRWADEGNRQGELGFALAREHQGQGLAAEAAQAVLRVGFQDLDLHRITAVCVAENTASARLLYRLGFLQEAHLRESAFFKGRWADQLLFGLLEEEWRAGEAPATTSPSSTADRAEIVELVGTFFRAFTSGDGAHGRIAQLHERFLPQAVVVRTCGEEPAVLGVDQFLAPRERLLSDGSLVDFQEWPVQGRLEIFGDVAHWFGSYTKVGIQAGARVDGAGMKSLQLVRTGAGWRISAAAWDDERDDLSVRGAAAGLPRWG